MAKEKTNPERKRSAGSVELQVVPGEDPLVTLARMVQGPGFRHAQITEAFGGRCFGEQVEKPTLMDHSEVLAEAMAKAETGDKSLASRLLAAQALTLDAVFTEMVRISSMNLRDHPEAASTYLRIGLKAQTASRSTIEALTKLHQPREQVVKHITVTDGGQAVITDNINQNGDRGHNEKPDRPAHEQYGEGTCSPAMLGQDTQGNGVPITCDAGEEAVPAPRRCAGERSATRE